MSTNTASIGAEKTLSFTTYRKNGEAKPTPVWIADLGDGTLGFTTELDSWKAKRLRNNPNVTLQPCSQSGKITPGTTEVKATARVVEGADFERIRTLIKKKYGVMYSMINGAQKVRGMFGKAAPVPCGVVVTLDE